MREWTKEERYKPLNSIEEILPLEEKIKNSLYRQGFHVQPRSGLLNDPNGFIYDDDTKTWHLFYQWFPWGATHGLKYWYHLTSKDLVKYDDAGIGIKPDCDMDNKGAYSGSAIKHNGEIYIYYTGNHRDENWVRTAYTCCAKLEKDGTVNKIKDPIIAPEKNYSEHQRDPKAFYDEKSGKFYIIIGARSMDDRGCVLVYESSELTSGWALKGELKVEGYEHFGKMWECPSIEKIGEDYIFIFSPQFIKLPGRGEVTNHNIYLIGDLDIESLTFKPKGDFKHLDLGFEFYAAQCAANTDSIDASTKILSAWMGLPDAVYFTDKEEWSGCLTLPRELSISNGKLIQKPISAIYQSKKEEIYSFSGGENIPEILEINSPSLFEIEVDNDFMINFFCDKDGQNGITFDYSKNDNILKVSRKELKRKINPEFGEEREVHFKDGIKKLSCFIDNSSIEIFFNDGEEVFTSRIFPDYEGGDKYIKTDGLLKINAFKL